MELWLLISGFRLKKIINKMFKEFLTRTDYKQLMFYQIMFYLLSVKINF